MIAATRVVQSPAHVERRATGYDEAWVEDWCITDRGLAGALPGHFVRGGPTPRPATR